MTIETRVAPGWADRILYLLLDADPGLVQLKHAAKTVLAVVAALEAFRFLESREALYASMSAGFLMQSTAGNERRTRQVSMAAMGLASTLAVGLGSKLSGQNLAKELLLVGAAFAAFYVRHYIPGKAMFPLFAFVLTLLATVQPGGAGSAVPMMAAVLGGFVSAFFVYFYVWPDESLRAFRHAANLFVYRVKHARKDQRGITGHLPVLHRALAFEEEESAALGSQLPEATDAVLASHYEALQVLILLADLTGQSTPSASQESVIRFCNDRLDEITVQMERERSLLNA